MNYKSYSMMSALIVGALITSCNTNTADNKPSLKGMKCEFVPDGQQAVIYGKNLNGAEVIFPGPTAQGLKVKAAAGSNDSILNIIVPKGSLNGQLKVIVGNDTLKSSFEFRDNRNMIIDFDDKRATWGGWDPMEENEEGEAYPVTAVNLDGESVKLPATLPQGCSGNYSMLFGKYDKPWTMNNNMFIQYVANPLDGGRGDASVAGPFDGKDIYDLALKFEVYIPKEAPYKKVHTEIYFGPYDAPDKHGRDRVPIYFWEPFAATGSYATDGWQTVTIPLSEFTHSTKSAEDKFPSMIDLKRATNLTFVQFGDTTGGVGNDYVLMCVDNFRIVPIDK